jgi:hypothetical protein
MFNGGDFYLDDFSSGPKHPQFDLIKKHIERAVQDLFIESLRSKTEDLLYVFKDESQIDDFTERILNYWEGLENYEICKEVLDLTKNLKERWTNRESREGDSAGLSRIRDLFNH